MEEDFANIGICVCVGLSNLSPFGNLSHHVFFLFDLFLRHRRPINVAGVVVGTLDSVTKKLYCVKLFLTHLFRLFYMLTLLKLMLCLHPDLMQSKNPTKPP